ncbi:hypothetical protein HQ865_11460 [Mucilaginibacter mali]|uniref:YD repeat-containing protein n=1 Tax=Mucilaginibacter mali TaxID=2740462 RepID=A0A7D4QT05_9SPHI|nr:hypothetical protein [Mucilaginibacter mali]QKJ30349.1 hypothetical protein HQ865_11460 [Mucilaginibacter mali]
MKKTFLIGVVLSLCAIQLFAQTDPTNYTRADIVPPSPTAANLSKYGNVPVTMYTGMANVSVPIFTVQGNDLSLPISLTYNYNGHKPAEQTSWIGLGWSLQAGGVITHNVKGLDDEYNTSNPYAYENSAAKYNNPYVDTDNTYLTQIDNRTYDAEPDVYSFNFAGHSGKFARVKNRFVLFPVQKLKIAASGTGFNITTEDGTIYEFGEIESTQTKASAGAGHIPGFFSAFYLTKITNAAQTESITLTYTDEGTISQRGAWAQTWLLSTNPFLPGYNPAGTLSTANLSMPTWVSSKRLTTIQSSKYTVTFYPESWVRTDVGVHSGTGPYALATIGIATNAGIPVKTFHLDHSYFVHSVTAGITHSNFLKLRSVSETVSGGADSLTHYFDYYDDGSGGIPEVTGFDQVDHFNYYNGQTSFTMMPNTFYPGGANRTPVLSGAVLGSLKKVTYPTGGSTEFEYELNRTNTGNYEQHQAMVNPYAYRTDPDTENEITDTASFNSNHSQWLKLVWTRTAKNPDVDDPLGRARDNYHPEVYIYKGDLDGALVYTGKILYTAENDAGHVDSLAIDSGKYVIQVICDKSENWVDVQASFTEATTIPETVPSAGVRVKTITDNPVTGLPVIRKYKYEFGGNAPVNYVTNSYIERKHDNPSFPFLYNDYSYFTYSSMQVQSETPGLPLFYSKVTEDTGSDTTNVSRSVYFFQCLESGGNNLGVETAEELHYKKNSSGYTLLSSKFYDYKVVPDTLLIAVKPYVTLSEIEAPEPPINTYSAIVYGLDSEWKFLNKVTETIYNNDTLTTQTRNHYNLATRNLVLSQQTNSDGRVSVQKMKYPDDYAGSITGNLVAANVLAPVIEKQVWQKRSATDSVLIGGTITKYDSLLYKPVKIYALENAAGLASLSTETKDGAGKYNTLLSDSHYIQRATYTYDTGAKITAQQLTGGISTAYQYGYPAVNGTEAGKNAYPIAECRNATTAEFYTQNFEDGSSGTTGAAHTGAKYYSGTSYTVSWTRPNSRAYVITYWYKSGSTWLYSGELAYTGSSYTLSGGSAYDDVRIFPADAQMSTYTYLQGVGVSSTIDAKGITTYYTYDEHNRLLAVKDQYGNILKQYDYNYAH